MHSGWSVISNWASGKIPFLSCSNTSSSSSQNVFALDSIMGTFLGGVWVSLEKGSSFQSAKLNGGTENGRIRVWGQNNSVLLLTAAIFIDPPPSEGVQVPEEELKSPVSRMAKEDTITQELLCGKVPGVHTRMVVEPRSGAQFPFYLITSGLEGSTLRLHLPSQVLAGVGVRCRQLMKLKSINLYAFGMYVHPESLRAQLGEKYAGVPPKELKFRPEFYDDLLRHEVNLSVRLVVLYKGLTTDLVRSAFQVSLKNRLKKIKGAEEDDGLHTFCSYLSEDLKIRKGTVIDIHWQPGGRLHTVVDGRQVGTIFSKHLCRAFFDLYIGDPPVSNNAKHSIGESFGRMLNNSTLLKSTWGIITEPPLDRKINGRHVCFIMNEGLSGRRGDLSAFVAEGGIENGAGAGSLAAGEFDHISAECLVELQRRNNMRSMDPPPKQLTGSMLLEILDFALTGLYGIIGGAIVVDLINFDKSNATGVLRCRESDQQHIWAAASFVTQYKGSTCRLEIMDISSQPQVQTKIDTGNSVTVQSAT